MELEGTPSGEEKTSHGMRDRDEHEREREREFRVLFAGVYG